MALDYAKTAGTLLEKVGGAGNVASVTHCMTRLRFVLKDMTVPKDAEVEKVPGVIRVIKQGGQYQIVIGNELSCVYKEISKLGNFAESSAEVQEGPKENVFSRLCGFVAGCMTPLLPAMLGCGMIKVVLTLLTTFSLIDTTGSTYVILNAVGDAFFYFMPIMLANTTAKKLGSSPYLAMVVAGVMLHPDLINLFAQGNTSYFGLPVTAATYSSSVLPVLLMVPIMKYIEQFADKVSPNMVKAFLKPLIVVFISVPIALVVIGPLGTIIGNYMATGINFMYSKAGWLSIMVLSAAMPFIVMTGMHYALVPICTISMATFGYDAILVITMFCSNLAQGAASMAVAVKSKDTNVKSTATASGISAIVAGVTEPAMYGITLKYKTPMIGAMAGAGAAGLYAGITHLVAYTMGGSPSVLSVIQMIGGTGWGNLINGVVALVISLVVSFTVTLLLYKPEPVDGGTDGSAAGKAEEEQVQPVKPIVEKIEILSPLSGEIVPLKEVADPVFAEGILGQGVAVRPSVGEVYAPADGVISAVIDSKHALGITTDSGAELLIHVGLDTVKLNGEGFEVMVNAGDHIKAGALLMKFDIEKIKAAGYDTITPVLVSNMAEFISLKATEEKKVSHGQSLFTVV